MKTISEIAIEEFTRSLREEQDKVARLRGLLYAWMFLDYPITKSKYNEIREETEELLDDTKTV